MVEEYTYIANCEYLSFMYFLCRKQTMLVLLLGAILGTAGHVSGRRHPLLYYLVVCMNYRE